MKADKKGRIAMVLKNVRHGGTLTDIVTENGKIKSIGKTDLPGRDFGGLRIYPGLIDIHTHGCIGFDTMEGHITDMSEEQLRHGITTWYPTTMTMPYQDIIKAASFDPASIGGAHVPGIHAEGPYINEKYKGAQNAEYIELPDIEKFRMIPNVSIVTIAPELEGSEEFIRNCSAVVSIGHTDADYDTAMRAFKAGAKCLTHTFNAMPPIHHRAPGVIGAAADSGAYAQLICDGIHVHPSAVRMLFSIFGSDRVILISDSMRATGLSDGDYMFGGQKITVKGRYAMTQDGHLAGSCSNLFECLRHAIEFGIPEDVAVRAATLNPARLMGLNKGEIAVGKDADFIIVDDNFELKEAIIAN